MTKDSMNKRAIVESILPGFFELLQEELPYKIPKPFPDWQKILEHGAGIMLAARRQVVKNDFALLLHSEHWETLLKEKIPVYCLGKNIIRDFELTEVKEREPFLPKDWEPRLKDLMVLFPDSVIQTPDKDSVLYAFIKPFNHPLRNIASFKKGVHISAMTRTGTIYNTIFGIGDNGEILNTEILLRGSHEITSHEHGFLKDFRSIIIQVLLCLEYVPQYVEEFPQVLARNPRGKTRGKLSSWNPRMIGKDYERRLVPLAPTPKPTGSHRSPRPHNRRAFWRSQVCGKEGKDRVSRWILPTVVNKEKL